MNPESGLLRRAAGRAAAVTLPLLVLLALRSPYSGLALRAWLVALGAIAIAGLSRAALSGSTFDDGPRLRVALPGRRPAPERLRALEEIERAAGFARATAFDLHFRLRPHLVRVAEHRLAARGVSLAAEPERARSLLGEEAWELLRPDRPAPEDRAARGARLGLLRRVVGRLDEI